MDDGTGTLRPVKSVLASDIDYIELKHHNKNIQRSTFRLGPQSFTFTAQIPSLGQNHRCKLTATQLPIVINNATTGHKLQGVSVKSIFVHSWIQPHNEKQKNWNYVVLSRAEIEKGVFARKPLPRDTEMYRVPAELQQMIEQFEPIKPSPAAHRHRHQNAPLQNNNDL